jgi:hypothetical protein
MRPTPLIPAVLLATIAAAVPAEAATVSPTGVRFPQIAVNADGATVVAWERKTKDGFAVEARTGAGPLKLGRTQRLARIGRNPRVTIGADGTRAVQWLEDARRGARTVRVAIARPGHNFGKSRLLERRKANMATVAVAVQPNGRVVAVWSRTTGRLGFALASRNHAFGTARDLTTTGPVSASTIALDPRDGAVVLAYGTPVSATPPTNQQAAARTLTPSATAFSAPVVLSDPAGLSESHPSVVGGAGTGVAYTQTVPSLSLRIARRKGDGTWLAPEVVATPAYGPDVYAVGLQATLPADGSALAAWSVSTEPGGGGSISSRTVASIAPAPRGAFGLPAALTPANEIYKSTAVASAGAEAFIATAKAHGPVLLATKAAGATTLGAPVTLASDGDGDVLLAAAGRHVIAAWQRDDRLRVHTVR